MKLANEELDALLAKAGLRLDREYRPRCSYRKTEWLRTACLACGTQADYRLAYILGKNAIGEKVCRACTSCGRQTLERVGDVGFGCTCAKSKKEIARSRSDGARSTWMGFWRRHHIDRIVQLIDAGRITEKILMSGANSFSGIERRSFLPNKSPHSVLDSKDL